MVKSNGPMSADDAPYATIPNPYARGNTGQFPYVVPAPGYSRINQDHLVEVISTLIRDTVRLSGENTRLSGENARLRRDNDHLRRQIRTLNEPALIRRSPAVESFMEVDGSIKGNTVTD